MPETVPETPCMQTTSSIPEPRPPSLLYESPSMHPVCPACTSVRDSGLPPGAEEPPVLWDEPRGWPAAWCKESHPQMVISGHCQSNQSVPEVPSQHIDISQKQHHHFRGRCSGFGANSMVCVGRNTIEFLPKNWRVAPTEVMQ